MDSKLKHQVTFIVILGSLVILTVALISNATKIKEYFEPASHVSEVSASTEETVETVAKDSDGFVKLGNNLDAWKHDETFFDSEEDSLAMKIMEDMSTLEIRAVSVEKDLRVRVLDYNGCIKGELPYVLVVNSLDGKYEQSFSDDDKDGVFYIEDIKPGKYEVSLNPLSEWIVPDKPVLVYVKESVEYLAIEDIDILLQSENELSTNADDTMTISAVEDADKKIATKFGENEALIYGVDVSSANGDIDWNQVYKSGIRFAMIRAGYRGSFTGDIIVDERFAENAKNAIRAGLDVGAYFYSQAINEVEAVEEASSLLLLSSQFNITYPLCIRVDLAGGMGRADELDSDSRTKVVNAFCETVKNGGRDSCFYATKNWLNTNLDVGKIKNNRIWLAEYRKIPTYEGYYDMWEYSCKGEVPGIEGQVNLNISYIN